jgi:tetratricopeptide (TPR) repeat protein
MNVVRLELKQIASTKADRQLAELRYWLPGQIQYKSRKLELAEIAELYDFIDRDFTTGSLNLLQLGRRLFDWLDGTERWLAQAIEQHGKNLVLAIDAQGQLGGLPWEILSDEHGFLVKRSIVPIRVIGGFDQPKEPIKPSPDELRALFMATDPDEASGLSYEQEEALILEATEQLGMELRVEESGCLEELQDLWRRFEDRFQVFHLSGHANIKDGVPYFVTESLEGDRVAASVADLAAVFSFRYPTLIFLSGCRTGESASKGVTSSLAASLVLAGAPAVLGWGRSVTDVGATAAAMVLYQGLSQGFGVAQALALTYQELLKVDVPDWCLLRLYAKFDCWGKLVLPPGDAVRWRQPEASEDWEFLDAQGLVRVAGKNAFVGRRRYLQRGLKALKSRQNLGIWLYGLGGAGKSSIACRLLDRLAPGYQKLVITGGFDENRLLNKLTEEFPDQQAALTMAGSLVQRLTTVLKDVGRRQSERIVFLLDNFEDNLEMLADGKWVLKAAVVEPLQALLNGIIKSQVPHRVIVTSRYDVVLPGGFDSSARTKGDRQMLRLAVGGMGRDRQKLYRRLPGFQSEAGVAEGLQAKAQEIADGYPRLMWWLNDVLLDERTDSELILLAMEGKQQEFLENILAEKLLAQQEPGLVAMLERGMLFELPVPLVVLQSICADLVGFDGFVERSRALGLLEAGLTDKLVRVPRVLGLVVPRNQRELAIVGVPILYQAWIKEAELPTEDQRLEIYRLAMLAGNAEIAIKMAQSLSNDWVTKSRYRETVKLCKSTLNLQPDASLLSLLARAERNLGEVAAVEQHCLEALKICPETEKAIKAEIIHNLAIIYESRGELKKALEYCEQSIEIKKEIGDRQGEAASLHMMSIIYKTLGDLPQALDLSKQSIEIKKEIGDRQREAASLHQMSIIYKTLGDLPQALDLSKQSIEIKKEIGDRQGEAASLHMMSIIYQTLGDLPQALALSQQSIEIYKEIGDRQGEAASLHQMSIIYQTLGDLPQALALSQQSIEIKKEIGNRQGESGSLHMMSIIYQTLGDLPQALALSQQSIEIQKEIGDRQGESGSLHQMSIIYQTLGDLPQALALSQQSIEIGKEIGDRQGEAGSLAQMAAIAHQQGDAAQVQKLYLQAAVLLGSTGSYGDLITVLSNLGINDEPAALGYLAQSLWLTIKLLPNLEDTITIITFIYGKIPTADRLESLLGATAIYLCRSYQHPELEKLTELSSKIIGHAAQQQGIETQTDRDNWIAQNRLNDPDYFLPELLKQLELIIGDNWLFDKAAFLAGNRSTE